MACSINYALTHNNVVVALSNKLPLFDVLCRRIFVFRISFLTSDICEHALQEVGLSIHGRNLLFLADRYKLPDLTCLSNVNAILETLTLISNHVFESRKLVKQNFGVLRDLLLLCGR
jgi:hypothetical protein